MIERITSLFKSDAFVPNGAIFPDIDTDRLARELKLEERAASTAKKGLPRSSEATHDATEAAIIARVDEARRKGLENYEANKDAYTRRLASAGSARLEIKSIAGTAKGDFATQVKAYRGQMTGMVDDVKQWQRALEAFQDRHALDRPAYENASVPATALILLLCLVVESVLNGYLFAQMNQFGLLGGAFVAVLVSVVNIGVSAIAGVFSRFSRHRNLLIKGAGLLIIAVWIGLALGLNLAVAHFRDAVETLGSWSAAASSSLETLTTTPLALVSIESWLLMGWGCLIALISFLKFVYFGEPYPGYGRISTRRKKALRRYADMLDDALESLGEKRDAAVEQLKDANSIVREQIFDAVDALYGQRMMRAHLGAFLQQCDLKTTQLLKVYRDANRARRSDAAPAHFDAEFAFPAFEEADTGYQHRESAEAEVKEIGRIVDEAIETIHADYRTLMEDYPDPSTLIGLDMQGAREARTEAAHHREASSSKPDRPEDKTETARESEARRFEVITETRPS